MIVALLAGLLVLVLGGAAVAAFPIGGKARSKREATEPDDRVLQDLSSLDALLRLSGHADLAKALHDARTGSAHAGEILTDMREVLRRIRDTTDAYQQAGVRERVDRLIADVNARLGGPDRA